MMPMFDVLSSYWTLGGGAADLNRLGCVCAEVQTLLSILEGNSLRFLCARVIAEYWQQHSNGVMLLDEIVSNLARERPPLGALAPAD